jgi:hypothetical protein
MFNSEPRLLQLHVTAADCVSGGRRVQPRDSLCAYSFLPKGQTPPLPDLTGLRDSMSFSCSTRSRSSAFSLLGIFTRTCTCEQHTSDELAGAYQFNGVNVQDKRRCPSVVFCTLPIYQHAVACQHAKSTTRLQLRLQSRTPSARGFTEAEHEYMVAEIHSQCNGTKTERKAPGGRRGHLSPAGARHAWPSPAWYRAAFPLESSDPPGWSVSTVSLPHALVDWTV